MRNKKIKVPCEDCKKTRLVNTNGELLESYIKRSPVCRSCGAKRAKDKISKGWFKKGQTPWNKGKKDYLSEETKKRLSLERKGKRVSKETEFKKGNTPFNKGEKHLANEKHPLWKGDEVGYEALHTWVARHYGKPNQCEVCGTKKAKRFEWDNISGDYKRERSDWMMVCSSCHRFKHRNKIGGIWHVA